jgi:hypothetical protein
VCEYVDCVLERMGESSREYTLTRNIAYFIRFYLVVVLYLFFYFLFIFLVIIFKIFFIFIKKIFFCSTRERTD